MKIGIYGGCFNPPHKMHENIAKTLIKQKYLNKVIFVPTGDYYPKRNLERAERRYEMLKLVCKGNKKIEVSDYEIKNYKKTCQTLKYFQDKYPNDTIYFITGTDNFKELNTWKDYNIILEQYNLIVIQRNKDDLETLRKMYKQNSNITFLSVKNTEITSSIIREKLLKEGIQKKLKEYMNEKVIEYIERNRMYFNLNNK